MRPHTAWSALLTTACLSAQPQAAVARVGATTAEGVADAVAPLGQLERLGGEGAFLVLEPRRPAVGTRQHEVVAAVAVEVGHRVREHHREVVADGGPDQRVLEQLAIVRRTVGLQHDRCASGRSEQHELPSGLRAAVAEREGDHAAVQREPRRGRGHERLAAALTLVHLDGAPPVLGSAARQHQVRLAVEVDVQQRRAGQHDALCGLHGGDARSLRCERREQEGGCDHEPDSSSSSASPPPIPITQSSWNCHAARVLR